MTKRCTICDVTDHPFMSVSHDREYNYTTTQSLLDYQKGLSFVVDDEDNTICNECSGIISKTLEEMEEEDEKAD